MKRILYILVIPILLFSFNLKVNAGVGEGVGDIVGDITNPDNKNLSVNDTGHIVRGRYEVINYGFKYELNYVDSDESGLYIIRDATNPDGRIRYNLYAVGVWDEDFENQKEFGHLYQWGRFIIPDDEGHYLGENAVTMPREQLDYGASLYEQDNRQLLPVTTIPIFNKGDTEAIMNYIKNGDHSGANNADIIDSSVVEFDESIELPVGLKVTGGYAQGLENAYSMDKDCVFNWTQTVDTSKYKYDVDCEMIINLVSKNIGSSSQTDKYYSSGWIDFYEKNYDGANAITSKVSKADLNDILIGKCLENYNTQTGEKMPYKGYVVSTLKIRVRNICESKASNFVVVKIDKDGNSTTATVQDENGETVEDENYDGSDVADKENGVDMDLSNFVDILNFIRNGFGLFGSNGLIAMFRSFFSYLPDMWWTLILLGLGMIIFVGIINFLLKR